MAFLSGMAVTIERAGKPRWMRCGRLSATKAPHAGFVDNAGGDLPHIL